MMAMKQVSLHTNNSAVVGTHLRSHNITHCVSLVCQFFAVECYFSEKNTYSIARARGRSKFTYAKYCHEKWGGHASCQFASMQCSVMRGVDTRSPGSSLRSGKCIKYASSLTNIQVSPCPERNQRLLPTKKPELWELSLVDTSTPLHSASH